MLHQNDIKCNVPVKNAPQLVDNVLIQEMPAGFYFDTHFHRSIELFICLSGNTTITVQNIPVPVGPNEYIIIFPNVLHCAVVPHTHPCRILQIHFHNNYLPEVVGVHLPSIELGFPFELSLNKRKFLKGCSTSQLEACILGIQAELTRSNAGQDEMIGFYIRQLNILISRDLNSRSSRGLIYENPYLVDAALYINEHYTEKIAVSTVAQEVGISSRYLTRLFQKHLNLSVSTYITYVRISKSIDYMFSHPHYPLTALALDMGFSSQQHFSKVFKEKMGITPKKYFSIRPISH